MAGTVMAQGRFYPGWTGVGGANAVKKIALICPSEDDYVVSSLGTANDTSAVIVLPTFDEFWLLTKTIPESAHDSVKMVVIVQGKFTDELVTGYTTRSNGWFDIDTTLQTIADTLGGDVKKMAIPPDVEEVRIIWDGQTDNDGSGGNQVSSWIILKF